MTKRTSTAASSENKAEAGTLEPVLGKPKKTQKTRTEVLKIQRGGLKVELRISGRG